jgi:hypothetical protein
MHGAVIPGGFPVLDEPAVKNCMHCVPTACFRQRGFCRCDGSDVGTSAGTERGRVVLRLPVVGKPSRPSSCRSRTLASLYSQRADWVGVVGATHA